MELSFGPGDDGLVLNFDNGDGTGICTGICTGADTTTGVLALLLLPVYTVAGRVNTSPSSPSPDGRDEGAGAAPAPPPAGRGAA